MNTRSLEVRFWEKVQRGHHGECWPWAGKKNGVGYGEMYVEKRTRKLATHVCWLLTRGEWPKRGEMVCHACDNPICVNPSHLWLGNAAENFRDCFVKGRTRVGVHGESSHFAKLTRDQVQAIRSRRAQGESGRSLAVAFGVTVSTIYKAALGRTYPEVERAVDALPFAVGVR